MEQPHEPRPRQIQLDVRPQGCSPQVPLQTPILQAVKDLLQRSRKCLYVYQYGQHPSFGWLNARIATWFPFSIQICMNGRAWLAGQPDSAGIAYQRQDNCFPWIANRRQAQQLNPLHEEIFRDFPLSYYWSTYQSEWATEVAFAKPEGLRRLYPFLFHHALTTFNSADILRFLGKKLTANGALPEQVVAEVTSDLKRRQEGVRIKHRYNHNSIKMCDKAYTPMGSVLPTELMREDPDEFKVYRRQKANRRLRWLGIAYAKP